jgi:hypothetical protein
MSDLCQQCSLEVWGKDNGDLANMTSIATLADCKQCGIIQVDKDGRCVDGGCPIHSKQLRTTTP